MMSRVLKCVIWFLSLVRVNLIRSKLIKLQDLFELERRKLPERRNRRQKVQKIVEKMSVKSFQRVRAHPMSSWVYWKRPGN